MSMNKLIDEVVECVEREYHRASDKFGPTNNSDHESYAVLLEEFEEARFEVDAVKQLLDDFWACVKSDVESSCKLHYCHQMEIKALLGACELIQVAAMAKKAHITILDRSDKLEKSNG